ncbi:MAG TPA: hypothetical protein VKB88_39125 [Bryobacteraceae bacterium]|nr:hypothetical protein [Bryobacteraceae bacterium]
MAIMTLTPPFDVTAAFSMQLPAFLAAPLGATEQYVGATPAVPTMTDLGANPAALLHDAQQVYLLGLAAVANNAGAGAASPAGWRIFAGTVQGYTVMGRVSFGPRPAGWRLTAAYYGDRVWQALQASDTLGNLPQVANANYELRVLTVPGLSLEAFWLVDQSSAGNDLVVPFPAAPNQPIDALNQAPVYSMPNFLAAIRPLAQLRAVAQADYGG